MKYLVMAAKPSMKIEVLGQEKELNFKDAGFYAMCPVFDNLKDAEEWSKGKFQIIAVEL